MKSLISSRCFLLFFIVILAIYFRVHGLSSREIWYDEALDVVQAERSFIQIIHDVPTPIHYFFVHIFLFFGKNTFVLGLPSVIFGVWSVIGVYFLAKRINGTTVGLLSSLLMAVSPMSIEFSQQILHYSYFIFFTIMTLYFYVKLLEGSRNMKANVINLIGLIIFSGLNILTHVSSLLVLAIEITYLPIVLITNYSFRQIIRKYWVYLLSLPVIVFLVGQSVGNGFYKNLLANISFSTNNHIQIGFSLGQQLGEGSLKFNSAFYRAMFSWLGFSSSSIRLELCVSLAIIGVIVLFYKKRIAVASFFVWWIVAPFLYLYFFQFAHWFEEKYFIFIIPVYLIMIGNGFAGILILLEKLIALRYPPRLTKIFTVLLSASVCLFIIKISLRPISERTNYGFIFSKATVYSWRDVYLYFKDVMNPDDRIFVRSGEGDFFKFYFDKKAENTVWFEEKYLLSISPDTYKQNFVNYPHKYYFASIPDFGDTMLANVSSAQFLLKKGNFNISEIKFKKESPFYVDNLTTANWEYYEDFRTAKYLSQASSWGGLQVIYLGNRNLPLTYGYYSMVSNNSSPSFLEYELTFKEPIINFYFRPVFSLAQGVEFTTYIKSDERDFKEIYSQAASQSGEFSPSILVNMDAPTEKVKIKMVFSHPGAKDFQNNTVNLKSFLITNKEQLGVIKYQLSQSGINTTYQYDSDFSVHKSTSWLYDTIVNDSWIQGIGGMLFRLPVNDGNNDKPLMYLFKFPEAVNNGTLNITGYTSDNKMKISFSTDRKQWKLLNEFDDGEISTHILKFSFDRSPNLYLQISCEKAGPDCQLRDMKLQTSSN